MRLFGRISHVLDPRISAQCLVQQRTLAHASDYGCSGVEVAVLAVNIGSGMYKAGIAGDNAPCAVLAGMKGRLFGALCIGTGPGVMSTGT